MLPLIHKVPTGGSDNPPTPVRVDSRRLRGHEHTNIRSKNSRNDVQRRRKSNHSDSSNPSSPPFILPPIIANEKSQSLASLLANPNYDVTSAFKQRHSLVGDDVIIRRSMSDSCTGGLRYLECKKTDLTFPERPPSYYDVDHLAEYDLHHGEGGRHANVYLTPILYRGPKARITPAVSVNSAISGSDLSPRVVHGGTMKHPTPLCNIKYDDRFVHIETVSKSRTKQSSPNPISATYVHASKYKHPGSKQANGNEKNVSNIGDFVKNTDVTGNNSLSFIDDEISEEVLSGSSDEDMVINAFFLENNVSRF